MEKKIDLPLNRFNVVLGIMYTFPLAAYSLRLFTGHYTNMSETHVEQVCDITGLNAIEAKLLLGLFSDDVETAVHHYLDDPKLTAEMILAAGKAAETVTPAPPAATAPKEPSNRKVVSAPIPQHQAPLTTGNGAPVNVVASFAWRDDPISVDAFSEDTLNDLKRQLSRASSIPSFAIRIVFEGKPLFHDDATLASCGMKKKGTFKVAVLYAQRDENGSVEVRDTSGKVLHKLCEGEWSVNTSVRHVRERLTAARVDHASKLIVFNALSLPDASSFGQHGIHKGSVLTVVPES